MNGNRRQFDQSLERLKQALLQMGEAVVQAIDDAVTSLKETDLELARRVITGDAGINAMEEKIGEIGMSLIATQQPVAKDLRRILIAFRMAGDLERMGDLAVDIAKVTIRIGDGRLIKPLADIPRMAEIVRTMIRDSITAYTEENPDLAYRMAARDDEVDQLYGKILRELFTIARDNAAAIKQGMLLSFVAHHLERMADHATNIGEETVFLVKGLRPDLNR
jgi:phosphate transport system protein